MFVKKKVRAICEQQTNDKQKYHESCNRSHKDEHKYDPFMNGLRASVMYAL